MSEINIFGTGEKLIILSDGTIDCDVTGSGDIVKVDGKTNLVNRIILRLAIRRGELVDAPDVGSDLYTLKGLPFTALTREWIKTLVYDALIRDPLIQAIEKLDVIEDQRGSGSVRIVGNIVSVSDYKQISEEPHDFDIEIDTYQLNTQYVRSVSEVKGMIHNNLTFFTQGIDYEVSGDFLKFISGNRLDDGSAFLVTYTFYDVKESTEETTSMVYPFNLG